MKMFLKNVLSHVGNGHQCIMRRHTDGATKRQHLRAWLTNVRLPREHTFILFHRNYLLT